MLYLPPKNSPSNAALVSLWLSICWPWWWCSEPKQTSRRERDADLASEQFRISGGIYKRRVDAGAQVVALTGSRLGAIKVYPLRWAAALCQPSKAGVLLNVLAFYPLTGAIPPFHLEHSEAPTGAHFHTGTGPSDALALYFICSLSLSLSPFCCQSYLTFSAVCTVLLLLLTRQSCSPCILAEWPSFTFCLVGATKCHLPAALPLTPPIPLSSFSFSSISPLLSARRQFNRVKCFLNSSSWHPSTDITSCTADILTADILRWYDAAQLLHIATAPVTAQMSEWFSRGSSSPLWSEHHPKRTAARSSRWPLSTWSWTRMTLKALTFPVRPPLPTTLLTLIRPTPLLPRCPSSAPFHCQWLTWRKLTETLRIAFIHRRTTVVQSQRTRPLATGSAVNYRPVVANCLLNRVKANADTTTIIKFTRGTPQICAKENECNR